MLCLHVRMHLQSSMGPLLRNISRFLATPSINYHLPSLPVRCLQPHSHLTGPLRSQDTDGGEQNEREEAFYGWESGKVSTYSLLNRPVISLKGIILTAARDRGPNLACERLSFTLRLVLSDDVTNWKGLFFLVCFLWLWDDRYCDTGGKLDREDESFPSASLHQCLIYFIGF